MSKNDEIEMNCAVDNAERTLPQRCNARLISQVSKGGARDWTEAQTNNGEGDV